MEIMKISWDDPELFSTSSDSVYFFYYFLIASGVTFLITNANNTMAATFKYYLFCSLSLKVVSK